MIRCIAIRFVACCFRVFGDELVEKVATDGPLDPRISEGRSRRLDRLVRRSRSENSLPKTRCNEIGS